MSAPPGTVLGARYRIDRPIGRGGMSTVYLAFDMTLERPVAVKLMHREVARDSDQIERFRREARAIAKLSSPYVVGVIDADEQDSTPYIVLEYVEGSTLKEQIRSRGQLPVDEAAAYAIEIARGLQAAHEAHIVHRDVKPQNVLLDEDGGARVTDFGIARSLIDEGLTADGRVLGTTDYVSPEQALGHAVTPQSDLYSLGIVLYEMLTGDVPFHGENQVAIAMCHVRDELPDVMEKRPGMSTTLASVVDHATAKDLDVRYPDAGTMIADLEEALAVETSRSGQITGEVTAVFETLPSGTRERVEPKIRHPRRWIGALAALVVAGAVTAAVVLALGQRGTGTKDARNQGGLRAVSLSQGAVTAYDPAGDSAEHDEETPFAVDRDPSTTWSTESYLNGNLAKPGVGLVVDANPALKAREMDIVTPTPGWRGRVLGATGPEPPASADAAGWKEIGQIPSATSRTRVRLDTGGQALRWYLLWIEGFAPGQESVKVSEVYLYR